MKSSTVSPVQYSTVGGALVGVVLWALNTYAFPDGVPGALQVAVPILLSALLAGVASFWTHRRVMATEIVRLVEWNKQQRGTPGNATGTPTLPVYRNFRTNVSSRTIRSLAVRTGHWCSRYRVSWPTVPCRPGRLTNVPPESVPPGH